MIETNRKADQEERERKEIRSLLSGGLKTEVFPRTSTNDDFQAVIAKLRHSPGDLKSKLVIGGFTLDPVDSHGIEEACESCMYFLVHRRYCELPELDVPVEPEWSCRLWRI